MCGRFALITPPARLARYFQATLEEGIKPEGTPSWNVAPTDQVLGVRARHRSQDGAITRLVIPYRWGLIPSWAKDPASGNRLFNARGETVSTKPSFRGAFASRRIIVPADGFYEWHCLPSGSKQPHYFTRTDGAPLALAGLAEWWRDRAAPPDAPGIRSCTIITTAAGPDMAGIHDRMPMILTPDTFDLWLSPDDEDVDELMTLVHPAPGGTIVHHPVGPRVGNVRNNDPELIAPADPTAP